MKGLRKIHGLAAMSLLAALLAEEEAAIKSAKDSGLSTHISVFGVLRECAALRGARVLPIDLQRDRSAPRPLPQRCGERRRAAARYCRFGTNGGAMRTPRG